jgi:hypothetical protein
MDDREVARVPGLDESLLDGGQNAAGFQNAATRAREAMVAPSPMQPASAVATKRGAEERPASNPAVQNTYDLTSPFAPSA